MSAPEFSRVLDVRQCDRRDLALTANADERAALAERLGLVRIDRLEATLALSCAGETVTADGRLLADFVQPCAVSSEELTMAIEEPVSLRFVPVMAVEAGDQDIEIDSSDSDEIEYAGSEIDFGEAIAQSLALAIDPFATGPEAEAVRALMRDEQAGPFAALAALRRTGSEEADD